MAEILVCGFEPFGGRGENRSWEVVSELPDAAWLEKVQLPVDFAALPALIPELVGRAERALVLLGESDAAQDVQVERVALNVVNARIPDNQGAQPRFAELVPGAPLALFSAWDAALAAEAIAGAGVPVSVSHHAGTYACNASLYLALDAAGRRGAPKTVGFIHVPVAKLLKTPTIAAGISRLLLTFR